MPAPAWRFRWCTTVARYRWALALAFVSAGRGEAPSEASGAPFEADVGRARPMHWVRGRRGGGRVPLRRAAQRSRLPIASAPRRFHCWCPRPTFAREEARPLYLSLRVVSTVVGQGGIWRVSVGSCHLTAVTSQNHPRRMGLSKGQRRSADRFLVCWEPMDVNDGRNGAPNANYWR